MELISPNIMDANLGGTIIYYHGKYKSYQNLKFIDAVMMAGPALAHNDH